jgi:hypothetical protein
VREQVNASDVKIGDVLEAYGRVDMIENHGSYIQIGYEANGGNWGDFAPTETVIRIESAKESSAEHASDDRSKHDD